VGGVGGWGGGARGGMQAEREYHNIKDCEETEPLHSLENDAG
jgi:hypothetical protein